MIDYKSRLTIDFKHCNVPGVVEINLLATVIQPKARPKVTTIVDTRDPLQSGLKPAGKFLAITSVINRNLRDYHRWIKRR